jgi:hypothetical protein
LFDSDHLPASHAHETPAARVDERPVSIRPPFIIPAWRVPE